MDLKILSSQIVKIKIAFTNFYTGIIILTFLAAGNLAKCRHQLQIFFMNGVAIIL